MAVVIRMKRTGRRKAPCYRISVADSRSPRDGRTLENLGFYDPRSTNPEAQKSLDVERAKAWLERGALPSETVRSIFKGMGVYEGQTAKAPRKRPGRRVKTKTRERRVAEKAARTEKKTARQSARLAAKRAAQKAAAAEAESSESAE